MEPSVKLDALGSLDKNHLEIRRGSIFNEGSQLNISMASDLHSVNTKMMEPAMNDPFISRYIAFLKHALK